MWVDECVLHVFYRNCILQDVTMPTRTSLSEEDLSNLSSIPHEEIVSMLVKQRQVAARYKTRFQEVNFYIAIMFTCLTIKIVTEWLRLQSGL